MPESVATPTRERLLTSGALLFAEKGFDGVSVRAICKHAQTSNNMVHHYFKSKAGLREAIIEQFSLAVFAVPMRLLATPARSADDFAARMEMLFATIVEAYMEHRTILMVVTREQADLPALA
ncbi:MAG: AcrR family transcriptional regulator, partial [Myxococcota bacterium]